MAGHFGDEFAIRILHPGHHPEDHIGVPRVGAGEVSRFEIYAGESPVGLSSIGFESCNRLDDIASDLEAIAAQAGTRAEVVPIFTAALAGAGTRAIKLPVETHMNWRGGGHQAVVVNPG